MTNSQHNYKADRIRLEGVLDRSIAQMKKQDGVSVDQKADMISQLCDELRSFCSSNGYPHLSADELVCELMVDPRDQRSQKVQEHIDFLNNYIERWDAVFERTSVRTKGDL